MDGVNHPWLVVGADGAIGGALLRQLQGQSIPTIGTTRRITAGTQYLPLDLSSDPSHWMLPKKVDVAFLCAAVTSIERCRQYPDETRLVNVERTLHLAELLLERGAHLVFLSTNQVFDGSRARESADAVPRPLTIYGQQKAEVERELLGSGRAAIVRLTKVLSPGMKLLHDWKTSLKSGLAIAPFHDMVMSPISLGFTVDVLQRVGTRKPSGIFQVSAEADVSYADVAFRLANRLGKSPDLVRPSSLVQAGLNRDATPRHTTLNVNRLSELALVPTPLWNTIDAAIEGVIRE